MTAWIAREFYAPLWVVCAGLLAYGGALHLGRRLLRCITRPEEPSPIDVVTSVLLGTLAIGFAVELLGVLHAATRLALGGIMAMVWVAGAIEGLSAVSTMKGRLSVAMSKRKGALSLATMLVVITLAINLLIAAAPSTKFDEVFYHMLVPARVLHDHALRFYAYPLHAAAMPQFGYQVSQAPLHAVMMPDAANVVSWTLSVTMFVFFHRLLRRAGHSQLWAMMWCGVLSAGLHTAVYHVTASSNAFGELALAALVIAVMLPDASGLRVGSHSYALAIGVCAAAAAVSKISTAPVAVILLIGGMYRGWTSALSARRVGAVLIATAPILTFLAPVMAWQWWVSGAPAGPFLSALFPGSVYAGVPVHAMMKGDPISLIELALSWTPLLWAGLLGAILVSATSRKVRLVLAAVVLGQSLFIWTSLTIHPRFLSGLTYGAAMILALRPREALTDLVTAPVARWLIPLLLVGPWVAATAYYARPFAAVTLGLTPAEHFRQRYVASYADFTAIDSLLPQDAVLLATTTTYFLPSVYVPRFVVWSPQDARGAPLFQASTTCASSLPEYVVIDTTYINQRSRAQVFRDPRREAALQPFCVVKLAPR